MKKKSFIWNIFGQKVNGSFKDISETQYAGFYDRTKKEVVIHTKLDKQTENITLVHECVHALFDRLGYVNAINLQTEELICDQIAKCLCENFDIKRK